MSDYTKVNPQLATTQNGQIVPLGISLQLYNEDGSPKPAIAPTPAEVHTFLTQFIKLVGEGSDARQVYLFASLLEDILADGIRETLQMHHQALHSDHPAFEGYDEDVLCDGVGVYLSNIIQPEQSDLAGVVPANSSPV